MSSLRAAALLLVCAVLSLTSAPPRAVAGWFEVAAEIAGQRSVVETAPARATGAPRQRHSGTQATRHAVASSPRPRQLSSPPRDASTGPLPSEPVPVPTATLPLYLKNRTFLC